MVLFIASFIIGKASIPAMTISIDNVDLEIRAECFDMMTSL
jgi:hypothetical protein